MQDLDSPEQQTRLDIRPGTGLRRARPIQVVPDGTAVRGGDPVEQARVELVRRLRSREEEVWETVFAHVRRTVPHAAADGNPALAAGQREMIAACLDCGLTSIEQGSQWSGPIPPAVAAHARRAASSGVNLTTALCRCVAAYTLVWSFVLDEVARHPPPEQQTFGLLHQVSAALAAVLAHVQIEVAEVQSVEITRRSRSREQRCAEIVRRLLASEPVAASELAELRYDLDAWHIAVIATGDGAEEAVRCLAAGLGCRLLPIPQCAGTVWAWLGGPRRLASSDIDRVGPRAGCQTWRSLWASQEGASRDGEPPIERPRGRCLLRETDQPGLLGISTLRSTQQPYKTTGSQTR